MENKNNSQVLDVEEIHSYSASDSLPANGLMRTQSAYSTAIQVIKPRDLNKVIQKCQEEAAIAGDEFYYAWKQGGEIIEGPTVGAALAIARNWGNCAVDCKVEETPTSYIFHGAFIDLETGFNLVRPFRQNKQSPKKRNGEDIYKGDRGKDIIFQIGASKGIRNAVLNGVPKWLTSKVMTKAKENVAEKIKKMGIEKARTMIINKANNIGIAVERLESVYGKNPSWDIEKLVMLSGALRSIEDGYESAESLFPIDEKEAEPKDQNKNEKVDKETGEVTSAEDKKTIQVESASTENKPDEENKSDKNKEGQDLFTPDSELTPDMPLYWVQICEQTKTKKEYNEFLKKYKKDIESFSGKDYESIIKAFEKHETTLKK